MAMFWARGPLRRATWPTAKRLAEPLRTLGKFGLQSYPSEGKWMPSVQMIGGPLLGAIALGLSLRAGFLCSRNRAAPSRDRLRCASKASQVTYGIHLKASSH